MNKLNRASLRKRMRVNRECSRRHDEAANGAFCGHNAVQLANCRYAYLLRLPLLTLDEILVGTHPQLHVDAAVRAPSASLDNSETFAPKNLRSKRLKFPP
jgi:hypothetical protein